MKQLFVITFLCIVLIGCSDSSTNSGIAQGTNTGSFSGSYKGALVLKTTADAIGARPKSHNELATIEVEIFDNGTVRLTFDAVTLDGIVDDDGNWELEITINGFGS